MTTDDKEIVSAMRAKLADRVGWPRFELWFSGTRLSLAADVLTVETPSSFVQDWLRTHFRRELEAVAAEVLERKLLVQFRVNENLAGTADAPLPQAPQVALEVATPSIKPRLRLAESERASANVSETRKSSCFQNFVVGPGNRLAFTSAQLAVERAGTISPLFLHGPTGVGKTHLLEAIRAQALQADRQSHAIYLSSEQFTTHFIDALGGKGLPNFRRKYRGVDLLIIDDVQFFAGKKATLVELLYTIETLMREGKQLVLAADRPPVELVGLGTDLVARLTGGLVCGMEPPDYATRLGIVEQMCQRLSLEVPAEVRTLVAAQVTSHARELFGALNRLRATSLAAGEPITRTLAEEALSELAAQNNRAVRLPDIQRAVCNVFGLEPDSLQSSRKAKMVSHPRMLAMFLARKYTRAALSEIGQFFGRRSHSTVISASKKVESWMAQQRKLSLDQRAWNIEDAIRRVEEQLKCG